MSILSTFNGILTTARICVPTVIDAARGPLPVDVADRRLDWWSKKLVTDAEIDLVVRRRDNGGDGSEPLVVMSNHQSHFDIPVLFQSVPGRVRMVAKTELFKVPFFGGAMAAAGFPRIDRADRSQAVSTLRDHGGSLLSSGTRVWIAPEGTRSKTGEMGPFKSGGFRMAIEQGVRILPVAVDGTRDVLPVDAVAIRKGKRVVVTIGEPIDPAEFGMNRRKELMDEVRRAISSLF